MTEANRTKEHFHVLYYVYGAQVNDYITDRIGASEQAIKLISNTYFWDGDEERMYNKTSTAIGGIPDRDMFVRLVEPDVPVNVFICYCEGNCKRHPCMS